VKLEGQWLSLNEDPTSASGSYDAINGRFDRAPKKAASLADHIPPMYGVPQANLQVLISLPCPNIQQARNSHNSEVAGQARASHDLRGLYVIARMDQYFSWSRQDPFAVDSC
jgi:hypothetical protein